jgi:hypothetical protein
LRLSSPAAFVLTVLSFCLFCTGCGSRVPAGSDRGNQVAPDASALDIGFLLTMTFDEAKKISPNSIHVDPKFNAAADEISVLSRNKDGTPRRVRAKGHVFLQIEGADELRGLAQEALVGAGEVILRGKPLVKRGRSVIEGLEDTTVFFIENLRLHAIGRHRITHGAAEVTPKWSRGWREGPNPILPALSPEDVPANLRATPLLPALEGDDLPKIPR